MRPILTVTTVATDLFLLTEAEARQAIGVESGQDDNVLQLRKSVSAAITSRCNVWASGATTPTLRLETLSQENWPECPVEAVRLVRRPVIEVVSVTENSAAVDESDYRVHSSTGMLQRMCGDYPGWWCPPKLVVAYRAGWETVPNNLRSAAMKLAKVLWAESVPGDPNAKRINIPGVYEIERWVAQGDDPLLSREIEELLGDYINPAMG